MNSENAERMRKMYKYRRLILQGKLVLPPETRPACSDRTVPTTSTPSRIATQLKSR